MSYVWQSSGQRRKAIQAARERQKHKSRKRLKLQRVRAELKILDGLESSLTEARVVLTDVSPAGLGFFANVSLPVGQEISLTMEHPKRFYVKARVLGCQEHDIDSHVLSRDRFSFRLAVEFIFENDEERRQVRSYCEQLQNEYLWGASFASMAA